MDDSALDLDWIKENLESLSRYAASEYRSKGRGALLIDHSLPRVADPRVYYIPESELPERDDPETKRMVEEYVPRKELVVVIMKPHNQASSYRVAASATTVH